MDIKQEIKEIVYHDSDVEKLMTLFSTQRQDLLKELRGEVVRMKFDVDGRKIGNWGKPMQKGETLNKGKLNIETYNQALQDVIKLLEKYD